MASEPRRPPTRTGSGSRPPTSRFQEGSMNDRASAAPPPQFLGPEELLEYESQFYNRAPSPLYDNDTEIEKEKEKEREGERENENENGRAQTQYNYLGRPATATPQLQAPTTYRPFDAPEQQEEHRVTHKKSSGFFGRVRDALFNRGCTAAELREKPSMTSSMTSGSLQEPLRQPPPPSSPSSRAEYTGIHTGWAQSEINIAQMLPSPRRAADRPTKEEVEASYRELMASGFFKSHAIQSTRHAPPKSMRQQVAVAAAAAAVAGSSPGPGHGPGHGPGQILSEKSSHQQSQCPPCPPMRTSSINAPTRTSSISAASLMAQRMPSSTPALAPAPAPTPRQSRERPRSIIPAAQSIARNSFSSLSSLFTAPSISDLRKKESRYTLRGRKRTRGGDGEETPRTSTTDSNYAAAPSPAFPTAYFAQPLKRVAKKLRKTPSSTSQSSALRLSSKKEKSMAQQLPPRPQTAGNGIVRLVPSISTGGSIYPNDRAVHMRAPSPVNRDERISENVTVHHPERAPSATRRHRKTFSYKLTEPARNREKNREREATHTQQTTYDASSLDRSTRGHNHISPRSSRHQRASLEETIIHCDPSDAPVSRREWEQQREVAAITTAMGAGTSRLKRSDPPPPQSALQTMPDANRGMPSVRKAPERWHGSGKAYHLKDRGSRLELVAADRKSEAALHQQYEKENTNTNTNTNTNNGRDRDRDSSNVDVDGDVDMHLQHHQQQQQSTRRTPWLTSSPSSKSKSSTSDQHHHLLLHQQHWHIGSAL
ncbi:hypothetical protein GGR50DRAFT_655949 [Xylaria sp. CBS 124048]|nr:hypothetical protein GGR50DRAFT_655949 [Xylaria sp. CBS 124048]